MPSVATDDVSSQHSWVADRGYVGSRVRISYKPGSTNSGELFFYAVG